MMVFNSWDESKVINLTLSSDDLAILSNCLNEVLNGFVVHNFEQAIGASRKQAIPLLSTFHQAAEAGNSQTLQLKRSDVNVLSRAVRFTLQELGVEFSTRSGFTREEAETLAVHIETFVN